MPANRLERYFAGVLGKFVLTIPESSRCRLPRAAWQSEPEVFGFEKF
jgi:hypothetical protein